MQRPVSYIADSGNTIPKDMPETIILTTDAMSRNDHKATSKSPLRARARTHQAVVINSAASSPETLIKITNSSTIISTTH